MQSELSVSDKEMIEKKLKENADIINESLKKFLNLEDSDCDRLFKSMRYSCLSEGKKIRAFLLVEFFQMFNDINNMNSDISNGNTEKVISLAAAVEMIHAYSLIHDDLPCMDNGDMRRGKPTNHKAFDEATALLAGDSLLTYAFEIIANTERLEAAEKVRIISETAHAAGFWGMAGGQMMDIGLERFENKKVDIIKLIKLHTLKTGNMIMLSARIGAVAGGADEDGISLATDYSKNIGLAFQVIDDILDKTGDPALLGKNIGSDTENKKTTFVDILGIDGAYKYARDITLEALICLEKLKEIRSIKKENINTYVLETLAKYLLERKS